MYTASFCQRIAIVFDLRTLPNTRMYRGRTELGWVSVTFCGSCSCERVRSFIRWFRRRVDHDWSPVENSRPVKTRRENASRLGSVVRVGGPFPRSIKPLGRRLTRGVNHRTVRLIRCSFCNVYSSTPAARSANEPPGSCMSVSWHAIASASRTTRSASYAMTLTSSAPISSRERVSASARRHQPAPSTTAVKPSASLPRDPSAFSRSDNPCVANDLRPRFAQIHISAG